MVNNAQQLKFYRFGFGLLGLFMPSVPYFIEAFGFYAASALAAATLERSIMGALIPLAGPKMLAALGFGWTNTYVFTKSSAI